MIAPRRHPWRVRLDPAVAREVTSLNFRIDAVMRVFAALVMRRNILVRGGRPIPVRKLRRKHVPPPAKPAAKQPTLFE